MHSGNDSRSCASAREQVLAFAAHDLCNHLQVISGAFKLIQWTAAGEISGSIDEILDDARSSLDRATRLGRQIANGGATVRPTAEPVSIEDRLEALRQTILLVAGPAIAVEFLIAEDLPEVRCAAEAFDSALLNIVGNAARALPHGGCITMAVMQEYLAANEPVSVMLRIADNGCGMPADVAARAFEPWLTTRPSGTGSGIGLAMVAAFARSAGGSAELETYPNLGTVVTMRLPGVPRHVRLSGGEDSRDRPYASAADVAACG